MRKMKKWGVRLSGIAVLLLASSILSGCVVTSGAAFGAASGAMAAKGVGHDFKYYVFDVPPQVIYRIDDHRFFTLENYKDCDHGGLAYYNDTKNKIKKYVGGGSDSNAILSANPLMSWKGEFIYAASEDVIAYIERFPRMSDRDTHSGVFLTYEIGGEYGMVNVGGDYESGLKKTILVMNSALYLKSPGAQNLLYTLPVKSMNSFNISEDYPESAEGDLWPHIQTPSGTTHFTCNNMLKPSSVSVTPEQVYSADATEVPKHD
ncbi:hypothetical protein P2H57_03925 [Citrobacter freundii]|uniref:T6SS immunity protein Tli3 family protein n=1 Tax=Citrobacter freundii TaxID=546 RepID=UPI001A264A12|nr:hypothetical protein [Citrobacter freundii]MDK2358362.1 hypothetical protein [Citrobacter freundii]HAU4330801.1 hypothetical protein [Citrobacter freundii]